MTTITVNKRAEFALDTLSAPDKNSILQTIATLKQTPIGTVLTKNHNLRKLAMDGDVYMMKVAPDSDFNLILERIGNSIEIADIVRYERIRRMYN
jgi:hypothetical protein